MSDGDKKGYLGVITPETVAYLEYRSKQFQLATQKKGQPLTYGSMKKEVKG